MNWIIVTEETVYSNIFYEIFLDVLKSKNVSICNRYLLESGSKEKLLKFLMKRHIDKFLGKSLDLLFQPNYKIYDFLSNTEYNIVIFLNGAFQKIYTEKRLKRIKYMFPNSTFVLLFVDAVFQKQAQEAFKLTKGGLFDLIYTYDNKDANTYGFTYTNIPYSKIFEKRSGKGVYFCGSNKGRVKTLMEIADRLQELGINYKFDVYGNPHLSNKYFQTKKKGYIKYENVVKNTLDYNCILDIVQAGREEDTGLSLRVYEATVYNKILVTNNSNILNYQFYNPQYMHYIQHAIDIKKEWFFDIADFGYSGELSPIHFFEDILKRINYE